jgi:hypothetical protein
LISSPVSTTYKTPYANAYIINNLRTIYYQWTVIGLVLPLPIPPGPEQDRLKVYVPAADIFTVAVPAVDLLPLQPLAGELLALQLVALLLLQVNATPLQLLLSTRVLLLIAVLLEQTRLPPDRQG